MTIGRKTNNTLAIEDPAVSGHQAGIVKIQAVFFLEDLKSTNGAAIDGQPITRRQLRDGDLITIGRHQFVFQENAGADAIAPTPFVDLDRTTVLRATGQTADGPTLTAKILIVVGKTDRLEYSLTKQVNVIGSQDGAAIRLTGWFPPKICGDHRPTRPQLLHQPFSGCEVSARQWHGSCGTTGPEGW